MDKFLIFALLFSPQDSINLPIYTTMSDSKHFKTLLSTSMGTLEAVDKILFHVSWSSFKFKPLFNC